MEITLNPSLPSKQREGMEKLFDLMLTLMMCAEVVDASVRFNVSRTPVIRMAMEEHRCKLQDEGTIEYFRKLDHL